MICARTASAALVTALAACTAQLGGPPVCPAKAACAKGSSCVIGRCRPDGTLPVASRAPRLWFEPTQLAIADAGAHPAVQLGPALWLGRGGRTALWLRFGELREAIKAGWAGRPGEPVVQRALLVIEPEPACEPRAGELRIELAEALEPWASDARSARSLPRTGLPAFAGRYPTAPPQPLRIDVTEMARSWARRGSFGLIVFAQGEPAAGCYASGNAAGGAPHLEVFLQPPEPKKELKKQPEKSPERQPDDDDAANGAAAGGGRP